MTPLTMEIGTNQKGRGGGETEVEHQGKSEGKRMKKCSVLNMPVGFSCCPTCTHSRGLAPSHFAIWDPIQALGLVQQKGAFVNVSQGRGETQALSAHISLGTNGMCAERPHYRAGRLNEAKCP